MSALPAAAWRIFFRRLVVVLVAALVLAVLWVRSDAAGRLLDRMLYLDLVEENARACHLAPATVLAVICVESSFNPQARSAAGAVGLMQLMPATAAALGAELGYRDADLDLTRPEINIRLGCHYLAGLVQRFGTLDRALQAYNGGPATVPGLAAGDTHPYAETRAFVERVQRWHWRFTRLLRVQAYLRQEAETA